MEPLLPLLRQSPLAWKRLERLAAEKPIAEDLGDYFDRMGVEVRQA